MLDIDRFDGDFHTSFIVTITHTHRELNSPIGGKVTYYNVLSFAP